MNAKIPKKRGRKPKGGKIIDSTACNNTNMLKQQNVILHLKCNMKLLKDTSIKNSSNNYEYVENKDKNLDNDNINVNIEEKLLDLSIKLHYNNSEKKSACFWCTYDFDSPPVYIPMYELNSVYHCYGCFCSPECAAAHLFKEDIDTTAKFERYHLLNHLYCKIYNYEKKIKPAPNPYFTLEKYYGNLTIQEYRKLLPNERLLLVIDKPLSRILPELHDDNSSYMMNSSIIPSASESLTKSKIDKKSTIIAEQFKQENTYM
tara:strand:+ start:17023 stop:17802 length:780 start_codon:yes stop_codon:yes gene_type:complete